LRRGATDGLDAGLSGGRPPAPLLGTAGLGGGCPPAPLLGTAGLGGGCPLAPAVGADGLSGGRPPALVGTAGLAGGCPPAPLVGTTGLAGGRPLAPLVGVDGLSGGCPPAPAVGTTGLAGGFPPAPVVGTAGLGGGPALSAGGEFEGGCSGVDASSAMLSSLDDASGAAVAFRRFMTGGSDRFPAGFEVLLAVWGGIRGFGGWPPFPPSLLLSDSRLGTGTGGGDDDDVDVGVDVSSVADLASDPERLRAATGGTPPVPSSARAGTGARFFFPKLARGGGGAATFFRGTGIFGRVRLSPACQSNKGRRPQTAGGQSKWSTKAHPDPIRKGAVSTTTERQQRKASLRPERPRGACSRRGFIGFHAARLTLVLLTRLPA
jgi:hypothetical protein